MENEVACEETKSLEEEGISKKFHRDNKDGENEEY